MADFQGSVASYDPGQGSGFIMPAGGSTYPTDDANTEPLTDSVYFTAVQLRSPDVSPGQAVTFDIQVDTDGLQAINISAT
jgi:cold shock CspA family protein